MRVDDSTRDSGTTAETTAATVESGAPVSGRWPAAAGRYATLIGFAVMYVVFALLKPDVFPTLDNAWSIAEQAAPIIVLAVGLTVVLLSGEFDLSFPGLIALAAVLSVKVMEGGGSTCLAVLVGIGSAVGAGIITGALVATRRAGSFITTLALSTVWAGLAIGISGGQTIMDVTPAYGDLTFARPLGIPLSLIYALVIALIAFAAIRWTVPGRYTQAVGSNPVAARLAGISAAKVHIGVFAVMGACAGIAAVILASRAGGYSPNLAGGLFLPPFVAAFFGLSVLAAGRFNVFGTVVGALFIGTLQTGLTMVGTSAWVGDVVVGVTLLLILGIAAQAARAR